MINYMFVCEDGQEPPLCRRMYVYTHLVSVICRALRARNRRLCGLWSTPSLVSNFLFLSFPEQWLKLAADSWAPQNNNPLLTSFLSLLMLYVLVLSLSLPFSFLFPFCAAHQQVITLRSPFSNPYEF